MLPFPSPHWSLARHTARSQQSAIGRGLALNRTRPRWHPDSRLPASRAVRNACLSFISYLACAKPERTKVATVTGMGEEASHVYLREGAPCNDRWEKDWLSKYEEAGWSVGFLTVRGNSSSGGPSPPRAQPLVLSYLQ